MSVKSPLEVASDVIRGMVEEHEAQWWRARAITLAAKYQELDASLDLLRAEARTEGADEFKDLLRAAGGDEFSDLLWADPLVSSRKPLTPCGMLACTGCSVCGCAPLGILPLAERRAINNTA